MQAENEGEAVWKSLIKDYMVSKFKKQKCIRNKVIYLALAHDFITKLEIT